MLIRFHEFGKLLSIFFFFFNGEMMKYCLGFGSALFSVYCLASMYVTRCEMGSISLQTAPNPGKFRAKKKMLNSPERFRQTGLVFGSISWWAASYSNSLKSVLRLLKKNHQKHCSTAQIHSLTVAEDSSENMESSTASSTVGFILLSFES